MIDTLYRETLQTMARYGHAPEDVAWVGSPAFGWCTWPEFAAIAKTTQVQDHENPTETAPRIAEDLVIRGVDTWMLYREVCPDCGVEEYWVHLHLPEQPKAHRIPERLSRIGTGQETLEQMHLTEDAVLGEALALLGLANTR